MFARKNKIGVSIRDSVIRIRLTVYKWKCSTRTTTVSILYDSMILIFSRVIEKATDVAATALLHCIRMKIQLYLYVRQRTEYVDTKNQIQCNVKWTYNNIYDEYRTGTNIVCTRIYDVLYENIVGFNIVHMGATTGMDIHDRTTTTYFTVASRCAAERWCRWKRARYPHWTHQSILVLLYDMMMFYIWMEKKIKAMLSDAFAVYIRDATMYTKCWRNGRALLVLSWMLWH